MRFILCFLINFEGVVGLEDLVFGLENTMLIG